jgi:hypothetical protein
MGELRNAYTTMVGISEGKGQLGSSRHRWKDDIKVYLKETEKRA